MQSFTTRRRGLQKGRQFREPRVHDENDINLLQLAHDAYYSMNITQLAKHAAFLLLGIFMMLMHVSTMNGASNTAYFRTSITQQLSTTFNIEDQDLPTWQSVNSFASATEYYSTFLNAALNASDDRAQPLNDTSSVMLGAYGRIMYARLIVNFLENCQPWRGYDRDHARNKLCINDPSVPARVRDIFGLYQGQDYTRWHDSHNKYYKFRSSSSSKTDWSALVVIRNITDSISATPAPNPNAPTRDSFRQTLVTHLTPEHVAAIDKYAYAVGLDIIAFNTLTANDYAVFSLRAQRSSSGRGVSKEAFQKLSVTTPGKRYLYSTHRDGSRKALEVVFWLAYFWLISLDYAQWRLARRQGCSLVRYIFTPWNAYTIVINLALLAWLLWYFFLLGTWAMDYDAKKWANSQLATCVDFYRYEYFPAKYTEWVYWGVAVMLLVGMRMLQFTRLHSGLNVFHDVFVKTMRDLADFFAVFIFILCLLGTCVYLIFQVSGGNPNWITWWDGASVLSRLAFQYASYDDIYNNGIGAGRWGPVITAIFWLSVAALLVWSGNIFLSAVSYAYGAVRDRNPQVEVFFLWEILLRFYSFFAHLFWMLIGHRRRKYADAMNLVPSPILPPLASGTPSPPPTNGHLASSIELGALPPAGDPASPPLTERSQRSGILQLLVPGRAATSADVALPRTGSRAQGPQHTTARRLRRPQEQIKGVLERCRTWFHLTDIAFYRMFYTENPAQNPRWYMLSRWAVACRPEMRALAVYFTDFRTFTLAKAPAHPTPAPFSLQASGESVASISLSQSWTRPTPTTTATTTDQNNAQSNHSAAPALSPHERASLCYHIVGEGESAPPEDWIRNGVKDFISQDKLKRLLDEVQRVHPATLACARPWFFMFPMRMTKYLLGYFWQESVHDAIHDAIKKVYNPQFMKDIESSFAIDEDEEGAVPTLRDLQARVQDPMQALMKRTAALERTLHTMETLLRQMSATHPPRDLTQTHHTDITDLMASGDQAV